MAEWGCRNNASDEDTFKCIKGHSYRECTTKCKDCKEHGNMKDEELYAKAITSYGKQGQTDVAMEEMGELIQALIKYRRKENQENLEHIREEIADVQIMIDQLKIIYDWHDESISKIMAEKKQRLKERMESEWA